MLQKTSNPMPIKPGRKVNPKMTTNRSMMMPTQNDQLEARKKVDKKKANRRKKRTGVIQDNTSVQPDFIAPQQPVQSQKRGGANMSTNESVNTQQIAQIIYKNLGETIVKDELIDDTNKKEVCEMFIKDAGGATPSILGFLNQTAETSLTDSFTTVDKFLRKLQVLYQQQESLVSEEGAKETDETKKWKSEVKKVYDKAKASAEKFIETLNISFLQQEVKYNKFKELVVLTNTYPYGEIPSFVHGGFYIFTISLIKAGLFKILMEDFYPPQH